MDIPSIIIGTAAMILLIVIPGVAISLALFPRKDELDIVERMGFSFALGLVPQLLQYFFDKNLNVPISTATTLVLITAVTVASLLVWKIRQK